MSLLLVDFGNYIASLPDDGVSAIETTCSDFFAMHTENREFAGSQKFTWDNYNQHSYRMFFQVSQQLLKHFRSTETWELANHDFDEELKAIVRYFAQLQMAVSQWAMEETFKKKFVDKSSTFKLAQEDVSEMNAKIGELREIVSTSEYLNSKHRRRLLLRLEKFQSEVHKAISDFDVFLAGWSEVNDMVEDTGNKSKPIVERFTELFGIAKRNRPAMLEQDDEPKQITNQSEGIEEDN